MLPLVGVVVVVGAVVVVVGAVVVAVGVVVVGVVMVGVVVVAPATVTVVPRKSAQRKLKAIGPTPSTDLVVEYIVNISKFC